MLIRSVTVGLTGLLLTACGSTRDTRVPVDAADTETGTGFQSQDIQTMAVKMAADIKAQGVLAPSRDGVRTSFFIGEIENESSDRINKRLILTKIRTQIKRAMGSDVMVLDRSPTANELVDAERRMKDRQQVSGENTRKIAGSDFVLKGVMMSRDRQGQKLRSSYINVTFELTDLGTGEIVWTDDYEMKTESEKSVINR